MFCEKLITFDNISHILKDLILRHKQLFLSLLIIAQNILSVTRVVIHVAFPIVKNNIIFHVLIILVQHNFIEAQIGVCSFNHGHQLEVIKHGVVVAT